MNQPFKNLFGGFQPRTYRTQFNSVRFQSFEVKYLETDLWIGINPSSFKEEMKAIVLTKLKNCAPDWMNIYYQNPFLKKV
jgi:uncharacterized protein